MGHHHKCKDKCECECQCREESCCNPWGGGGNFTWIIFIALIILVFSSGII